MREGYQREKAWHCTVARFVDAALPFMLEEERGTGWIVQAASWVVGWVMR